MNTVQQEVSRGHSRKETSLDKSGKSHRQTEGLNVRIGGILLGFITEAMKAETR
jgi:hypothetical protein